MIKLSDKHPLIEKLISSIKLHILVLAKLDQLNEEQDKQVVQLTKKVELLQIDVKNKTLT